MPQASTWPGHPAGSKSCPPLPFPFAYVSLLWGAYGNILNPFTMTCSSDTSGYAFVLKYIKYELGQAFTSSVGLVLVWSFDSTSQTFDVMPAAPVNLPVGQQAPQLGAFPTGPAGGWVSVQ